MTREMIFILLQPAVPFLVPPQTATAVLSDAFQDLVYMRSSVICHYTSIARNLTLTNQRNSSNAQGKVSLWSLAVGEVPAVRVCSSCILLDGRSESMD
ncbi:hypothetical protein M405DRAFT_806842 [Rhizopogon salebrosus TDB-379]|nr:hypothetical protein M405DRAFT_806842 [Rhizopogon salebrosus TDB-379]